MSSLMMFCLLLSNNLHFIEHFSNIKLQEDIALFLGKENLIRILHCGLHSLSPFVSETNTIN